MIEKLQQIEPMSPMENDLLDKVNELCDAVNELTSCVGQLGVEFTDQESTEEGATMSKDIWHTTDETPKPWVNIAFYVDGYLYDGYYEPDYNQYGIFGADKVEKWCYIKELSPYILALETELDRTRKALDVAIERLEQIAHESFQGDQQSINMGFHIRAAAALTDIEQITALEQKEK